METTMNETQWIHELLDSSGSAIGFRVREHLHHEQSEFQTIDVYESTDFGRLMALDDCWMVTQRDNFIYHEMLAHPALYSHAAPTNVAIIGGGDCGTLREVLKHACIESATQIDIDERVTRVSEQFFPELCSSNDDPRVSLLFEDGMAWIDRCEDGSRDLILVDSTDPVGLAEGLVSESFFRRCHRALSDQGIIGMQSESPLLHVDLLKTLRLRLANAGYTDIRHHLFPQPCYPSGWWCVTLACKSGQFADEPRREVDERMDCRYYNAAIHQASSVYPSFLRAAFDDE